VPLWRQILKSNFTNWIELANFLQLDIKQREQILKSTHFPLNLPRRIAEKINKQTLSDPLLAQFLPTTEEKVIKTSFCSDPVGDHASQKKAKLLHKYPGRVLLITTSACAMHCRYCFRQNFNYDCADKIFEDEIRYISQDQSLHEVILSGGDPLSLSDAILTDLITRLEAIPHLKLLRFHTRFPIGIPERIDSGFLQVINRTRFQIYFVIHANHPLELDVDVLHALKSLKQPNLILLNQSVLLKGVNDDLATLKELCLKLIHNGITPYYLHQLDRVQGAAHFEVSEEKGKALIDQLLKQLPGYAVPRYVKEISGESGKTEVRE
jgi:EF-P beta-lysylation protein EpmB